MGRTLVGVRHGEEGEGRTHAGIRPDSRWAVSSVGERRFKVGMARGWGEGLGEATGGRKGGGECVRGSGVTREVSSPRHDLMTNDDQGGNPNPTR